MACKFVHAASKMDIDKILENSDMDTSLCLSGVHQMEKDMSEQHGTRGYNDAPSLEEMARGLIVRRYSSVDEAAKLVLGEDGGSNVDRLRRKFREQNWYERGLEVYVEEEIARRNASANEAAPITALVNEGEKQTKWRALASRVQKMITPNGFHASLFSLLFIVSIFTQIGLLPQIWLTGVIGAVAAFAVLAWIDVIARHVDRRNAFIHVGVIAISSFAIMGSLANVVPDQNYTVGSFAGAIVFAFTSLAIAHYAGVFFMASAKRENRGKRFETKALGAMIIAMGFLGTLLFQTNMIFAVRKVEFGLRAYSEVQNAANDLIAKYPSVDVRSLEALKQKLANDAGFSVSQ